MIFNTLDQRLHNAKYWFQCLGLSTALAVTALPLVAATSNQTNASPAPQHVVSEQQAISAVFNRIEQQEDESIVINNRHHQATFSQHGILFTPTRGPSWHWQVDDKPAITATPKVVNNAIDYAHKGYTERYLLKPDSIEQRFIIEQPYQAKHDLVIEGKISSKGTFETTDTGWLWRNEQGVVSLGQVTVFDAQGKILPATMHTEADFSRITVAASALKTAAYPVTIDPEIGSNDFRLSDMGTDGDANFDGFSPVVSYNAINNEYFVVWTGDDNTAPLVDEEFEIFGQRVNAATGAEIGTDIRLSDMGPDGDSNFSANWPAVSYNATNNEYFVVWYGDDNTAPLVDGEFEIFGQRVNAATGAEIGSDIRLSDMGPDGNVTFRAGNPAVTYNATNNEYFVVWSADDNTAPLVDEELEIFGQRVNAATGAEIGVDIRLSDMGPDGDINFLARSPAVAYNATDNEYLVVWWGDDNTAPLVDEELEIFGQRVNAATGAEIGGDTRLSNMGPDGDINFSASFPTVAYNANNNEYLVVWNGDDDTAPLVEGEREIFGQRVNATTSAKIGGDIRLSDMGPDGDVNFNAFLPEVSYNTSNNEYLVIWRGTENIVSLIGEREIFGQRVNAATGAEIGGDTRLSDMGPDGDVAFRAGNPAVAYNATNNEYFVAWNGDDNTPPQVDDETEIFGQRFTSLAVLRFTDNAATVAEDAGSIQIEVQLVGNTSNTVTVDFTATDGTATAPADYTAANGTLTFNVGESSKTFSINITDNNDFDGDKTINLSLSSVQTSSGDVTLDTQKATATLTITDDDTAAAAPAGGGGGGSFNLLTLLLVTLLFTGRRTLHLFAILVACSKKSRSQRSRSSGGGIKGVERI